MTAIKINESDYYVTGVTRWDTGRVHHFDSFVHDPIVCPQAHRYGPEVTRDEDKAQKPEVRRRWFLPPGSVGYTVTYLTCVKLNAEQHAIADAAAEDHFRKFEEGEGLS